MFKFFRKKDKEKEPREQEGVDTVTPPAPPPMEEPKPETPPPPAPPAAPQGEEPVREERGLFQRLKQGLFKTRATLTARMDSLFLGKREITEELLDELEEILYTSDIGVGTTQELIEAVRSKVARKELRDVEKLKGSLRDHILTFLQVPSPARRAPGPGEPLVILVVGINGVGKTTTIGKAAHALRKEGKRVMLVAGDTFRAAAVEQLTIWGERSGAEVVKQTTGADPSAVAFDALSAALARKAEVVIIDTAGRLHTKVNLMEELEKISRVVGKKLPGAPHEVWLILDATTGQNAISQAEVFHKSIGITDLVLTKLDGTAKGGVVVGICHQLGIPLRFIGIGEKMDDLRPFHPEEFVKALFE